MDVEKLYGNKELNNALDELNGVSAEGIQKTIDGNATYYEELTAAHEEADKKKDKFRRDSTEEYGTDLAGRIY